MNQTRGKIQTAIGQENGGRKFQLLHKKIHFFEFSDFPDVILYCVWMTVIDIFNKICSAQKFEKNHNQELFTIN